VDASQNTTPSHTYRNPATYSPLLILQDSTGCILGVREAATVTVLGAVPFFSIDTHAFCDSGIVTLTDYTITNDGIVGVTWNFGDGSPTATQASTPFDTVYEYSRPGTFFPTLKVMTTHNCAESYTDTVRIFQTPHPLINTTTALCTGLIQFEGSLVTPDIDTVNWSWNFGDGQVSTSQDPSVNLMPGTYSVSLRTAVSFGCNDTTSRTVTINPFPAIKGPPEITTPIGFPVTIPFTYSDNIVSYAWAPVTNLNCPTCPDPVANPTFNTLYTVTVTDANNCSSVDSILVKTICNGDNYFLPNTFSPNGDGVNDVFYPRGSNLYNIQAIRIFNRWGQMVFERRDFPANSASYGWDGTFNGRPAPVDTYVYIVEVVCNNAQVVALKGDVTLVR
jgi:gliding motility-associated-like protein